MYVHTRIFHKIKRLELRAVCVDVARIIASCWRKTAPPESGISPKDKRQVEIFWFTMVNWWILWWACEFCHKPSRFELESFSSFELTANRLHPGNSEGQTSAGWVPRLCAVITHTVEAAVKHNLRSVVTETLQTHSTRQIAKFNSRTGMIACVLNVNMFIHESRTFR